MKLLEETGAIATP